MCGTLLLTRGDYVNVMVYSSEDNNFKINTQSGFSCHKLTSPYGFHAVKREAQGVGSQWGQIKGWRVRGKKGLYAVGGGFDNITGAFTVFKSGAYFCAARIQFDRTNSQENSQKNSQDGPNIVPYIRLHLRVNEAQDDHNGMHAVEGNNLPKNYHTLTVSGTLSLRLGLRVSVWVHANVDVDVNRESGFSCHLMGSQKGFHVDIEHDTQLGRGWSSVRGWRTLENTVLYTWGGRPGDTGAYVCAESGFYFCAAQVGVCMHACVYICVSMCVCILLANMLRLFSLNDCNSALTPQLFEIKRPRSGVAHADTHTGTHIY